MHTIPEKPIQTKLDLDTPKSTGRVYTYKYPVEDKPGKLVYLSPAILMIDPDYQRQVYPTRVQELASKWSWYACGVLRIAIRDGVYYIFDGQHRKLAAEKRGFGLLPCVVFKSTGVKQEARAFLTSNTFRKPIGAHDQFRARGILDDVMVQTINELAERAGRRIEAYAEPQTISCIHRIEKCLKVDADALQRVWPLLVDLCIGKIFHGDLVACLFQVERLLADGRSLTDAGPHKRLLAAGYTALLQEMQRAKIELGTNSSRAPVAAILRIANHRLRNRLELAE